MKMRHMVILLILWYAGSIFLTAASGQKTAVPLPEIVKPIKILADEKQFYIVEQTAFYIYQWQGFRLLKKVGSRGEGPQEYPIDGLLSIHMTVQPDKLAVYCPTKVLEYKKDGSFIQSTRLVFNTGKGYTGSSYKLGNFYIHSYLTNEQEPSDDISYFLCDANLNKIRALSRTTFPINPWKRTLAVFAQFLPPVLYNDMAFLADGDNLEIIGINETGKTFLKLKYPYERIKVTNEHINAYHEYFKNQHPNKSRYESRKSWFRFPDYFPAIKDFQVNDNQIYVQTYKINDKMETEFLIFNLKGQYQRTIYLPVVADNIDSDYPYLFHDGKFVQLVENLDEETWYLHITPIN